MTPTVSKTGNCTRVMAFIAGLRPRTLGLMTLGLVASLAASSLAIAAGTANVPPGGVTLEAVDPSPDGMQVNTGTAVELRVIRKVDGQGVAGNRVDWTISDGSGASLAAERSITLAGDEKQETGIARTVFTATEPGRFVVTASSQSNPGCAGKGCETFVSVQFVLNAAAAEMSEDAGSGGRPSTAAIAIAAGAGLALIANSNRSHTPAARGLAVVSGDGQAGFANAALPAPLVVSVSEGTSGVTVAWTATGGAVLSASSTSTDSGGRAQVSVLSLGPGPGPVTVTATRSGSGASVSFNLVILTRDLVQVSGNGQSAPTSSQVPNPLVVRALNGSTPVSGLSILWTVVSGDATISSVSNGGATDSAGLSSAVINFGPTPGPVVIRAARSDFPSISQSFTLTATLIRSLSLVSGDNQTAPPNTPLPAPIVVRAQNNGGNIAGVTINWSASGGAVLSSSSSVTDAAGLASVTVTSVGPGPNPVTITAVRADAPAAIVSVIANIVPPVLSKFSGDGQSGLIGSSAPLPLEVVLVDGGGTPVAGQSISWLVVSGSATLASPSSTTDATGHAKVNFKFGGSAGPVSISASAYGGSQKVTFNATAVAPSGLSKTSGDGQAGNPGTVLAPFVVTIASPVGGQLSGVPVTFSIVSGTGTLSVTSTTTDAAGQASTQLTLGLTPGVVTVLAQVSGGPSTTFTATINGSLVATSLTIVSGDKQTLSTGVVSQPMVVELKAGATPLAGLTVTWSTNNGSLSSTSGITDTAGRVSTTVTPSSAGAVAVTASFAAFAQYTASSVTFGHNTTIASIQSLSTDEAAVAIALDNACTALRSSSTLTPEQQDLLNQCQALATASGSNPGAVADAIEELLPDVAQTQTQTGQAAVNAQFENLKGRIATLRSGTFGSSFGGLALATSGGNIPLAGLASLLLGDDKPASNATNFQRWGVFASGNIGRGQADANNNAPRYDFDVKGLTLGVDYRHSDRLILGVALGYTRQDTTLSGGQGSLDMHGYSLSGYSTLYRENSWYMDTVLTLGRNRYDHRRRITFTLSGVTVDQLASAASDGTDRSATLTVGRDFHRNAWDYGVYGRALYTVQGFDGFQEDLDGSLAGSGLGLRVEDRTVRALSSVLGGKITRTHSTSWGVLVPQLALEWQREYSGDPDAFRAFLVNDPTGTPILITGDALDNSYFRLSLGLSMVMTHGRSGFIQYERILLRNGLSQDNLSLGFRMEF